MADKTLFDRLYKRPKRSTWYADLRDLGAGRVSTGTSDETEALDWLNKKLLSLKEERPDAPILGARTYLATFAGKHLKAKRLNRRESTIQRDAQSIEIFLDWAGRRIELGQVTPALLNKFARHRQQKDGRAPQTVLHELHALSSLFERAVSEGYVDSNPVRRMVDKPRVERNGEAEYLEPEQAAKFLAECDGDLHTLMAIALLTGGRRGEVCGLEWRDVDFDRDLIRFRANKWRKLKRGHDRSVKLWPQLRAILEALEPGTGLVVPSPYGGMYKDVRGGMESAAERAKISVKISWNTLRHTFASLRLQTLDHGAPISPFKVSKELGHSGLDMIYRHYGHVLESPQRLEVIEYREEED